MNPKRLLLKTNGVLTTTRLSPVLVLRAKLPYSGYALFPHRYGVIWLSPSLCSGRLRKSYALQLMLQLRLNFNYPYKPHRIRYFFTYGLCFFYLLLMVYNFCIFIKMLRSFGYVAIHYKFLQLMRTC